MTGTGPPRPSGSGTTGGGRAGGDREPTLAGPRGEGLAATPGHLCSRPPRYPKDPSTEAVPTTISAAPAAAHRTGHAPRARRGRPTRNGAHGSDCGRGDGARGVAGPTLDRVRGPDRREVDGRVLVTRNELARISGEREHTLYKWWAARARNGHPDGITLDGRLYVDEQQWRDWRAGHSADRRVLEGRVVVSRTELARVTGTPISTLAQWYGERARNGHPEGIKIGSRLYVDEQQWHTWHGEHTAALKAGLSEIDRGGDPDELLTITQAARLLGYADTSTLTSYRGRGQFVEPDHTEELPSGRPRRYWKRRTLWAFADQRTWSRPLDRPAGVPGVGGG